MNLIFFLLGLIYFVRRPRIARLAAADYPAVPPAEFMKWRRCALLSIDIFVGAAWGAPVLALIPAIAAAPFVSPNSGVGVGIVLFFGGQLFVLFSGMILSAIYDTKAARLRKRYNIVVPKWFRI